MAKELPIWAFVLLVLTELFTLTVILAKNYTSSERN